MKKILLLGGSAQQVAAIKAAKRLGYYTVLCDFLEDNPGQFESDSYYQISTTDREAVLKVAVDEQVDGILAYASDPAALTAAFVAERLGLPGNPYRSVDILCNKDKFRTFLRKHGFNTPAAHGYENIEKALADKEQLTYPVIIKPVDSSGSKGVTVLYEDSGISEALEYAFSFSRCHRIIVENFIEKKHPYLIGGDIFVIDGKIVLWGLLNCHRDNRINPLVPVGKSYPLQLNDRDMDEVKRTVSAMVGTLGILNGAMNIELIVDKGGRVWPIDVGPRAGGNMIPDLLGDMFGLNLADLSVQISMGEHVSLKPGTVEGCYATHNLHSVKEGIYKSILFSPQIEPYIYRKCLYKQKGEKAEVFHDASKCLGIIFMKFDNKEIMEMILSDIYKYISVKLEGGG